MTTRSASAWIRDNVLGLVAIFIALGGTAWAGSKIGAGEIEQSAVRSKHIKNEQVRGADVLASEVQTRVAGNCPAGQSIRLVNEDGSVACEPDDAGAGGGPPSGAAGGDLTGSYPSPLIATGAVGTGELAGSAVNSVKVADDSLTGADVDESTLQGLPATGPAGGDLAGNFPNPAIAGAAVDSAKVSDNSLLALDLASGSVGTSEVGNETLTSSDLRADSVTSSELAPGAVANSEVAGNAITGSKIAPNAVTGEKLQDGAVGTSEIGALPAARIRGSVDAAHNTPSLVDFFLEEWDTVGMAPAGGDRIAIPETGLYLIEASADWFDIGQDAGSVGLSIQDCPSLDVNTCTAISRVQQRSTPCCGSSQTDTVVRRLTAGRSVRLRVTQTTGSTVAANAGLSVVWLAPA